MKIILNQKDFEKLTKGEILEKTGIPGHSVCRIVEIALEDIGYPMMRSIITRAVQEFDKKMPAFSQKYGEERKLSDALEQQAREEDNDLKALGLMTKALREKRLEKFKDMFLKQLSTDNYTVEYMERIHRFTLLDTPFGIIDFYPKANKVLIRKDNDWKKPGLKWLIDNRILKAKSNG